MSAKPIIISEFDQRGKRSPSRRVAHSNGWQVVAGFWQDASVLLLMGFLGCPDAMIAGFFQTKYRRDQAGSWNAFLWPTFKSYILLFMSYSIGHTVSALIQCGKCMYIQGCDYQEAKIIWEPSWSLMTTWGQFLFLATTKTQLIYLIWLNK